MNTVAASAEQLAESTRQLLSHWNSSKGVWNDAARQDFKKEFVAEFEMTTAASIDKLQKLIDALAQADREIP